MVVRPFTIILVTVDWSSLIVISIISSLWTAVLLLLVVVVFDGLEDGLHGGTRVVLLVLLLLVAFVVLLLVLFVVVLAVAFVVVLVVLFVVLLVLFVVVLLVLFVVVLLLLLLVLLLATIRVAFISTALMALLLHTYKKLPTWSNIVVVGVRPMLSRSVLTPVPMSIRYRSLAATTSIWLLPVMKAVLVITPGKAYDPTTV